MRPDLEISSIRPFSATVDIGRGARSEGWADDPGVLDYEPRVRRTAPRVVMAGCPGAGKGTQGARLARRLGVQHLSTGDLLRDAIANQSSLGRAVERLVRAGRLVPTGLIVAIVEASLDTTGYVLDGFPRTVVQAEALFARDSLVPNVTIEIVVPMEIALARLTARGRTDDDPGVARDRLTIYEAETLPALALLDRYALLVRVDGDDLPHVVEQRTMQAFLRARRSNETPSPADLRAVSPHETAQRFPSSALTKQNGLRDRPMASHMTPAIHISKTKGLDRHVGRDRFATARDEQRVNDFYRSVGSTFFGAVVSTCGVHAAPSGSQTRPDSCPTLVTVLGELDLSTAPILRACFASIDGPIDVDCSGLEFVDAQGLGVLASTSARADASFVFVDPSRSLLRLLRVTGLDANLEIRSTASPAR
jgi:adenylate kinase